MYKYIIVLLFILEIVLFSFSENLPPLLNGIALSIVSFSIGLIPILRVEKFHYEKNIIQNLSNYKYTAFTIFMILGLYLISDLMFNNIISKNPINSKLSDVIPSIQVLVDRYLNNISIYSTPIPFDGYEVPPTYLPFQWGPFVIASYFNLDFRAFAFVILLIGIIIYHINVINKKSIGSYTMILLLVPFLTLISFLYYSSFEFIHTIETMVIGFYLIFIASIFSKSTLLKSGALLLCLLSRFSLLLWLPLYIYVLYSENKKDAFKVIVYTGIGLSIFYIYPYLYNDWGAFFRGYNYYTKAALAEWKGQDWQALGDNPAQLFKGVGLTSIFYKIYQQNITLGLSILQKFHLIISLLTTTLLIIYYRYKSKKYIHMDNGIFLLFSFKIYLTIFYSFIQVPYKYLYFVPIFISIYILMYVLTGLNNNINKQN